MRAADLNLPNESSTGCVEWPAPLSRGDLYADRAGRTDRGS